MNQAEKKAADFIRSMGFALRKFTKTEMAKSKTPDFRVYNNDEFAFFCEVKKIERDTWLEDQLRDAPPLTIVGGPRDDPRYNRIANKIHEASQQFEAINPARDFPNVLVIVNQDDCCGFRDLVSVTTGQFLAEGGGLHPIYKKYSEGRIKDDKYRIDLYIWMDEFKGNYYFYNLVDKRHLHTLCSYFDKDPDSIRSILEMHKQQES